MLSSGTWRRSVVTLGVVGLLTLTACSSTNWNAHRGQDAAAPVSAPPSTTTTVHKAHPTPTTHAAPPRTTPPTTRPPTSLPTLVPAPQTTPITVPYANASCEQQPPAGASSEALAYLVAVNATYPGWIAITQSLQSEGGLVSSGDMAAEIQVDTGFLSRLSNIHFSPKAEVYAAVLRTAVAQYIQLLTEYVHNPQPLDSTNVPHLDDVRAEASSSLRASLGLQQSTCEVLRP